MTKLVGIMGAKRAGKDTVANILSRVLAEAGKSSEVMAVADPIRSMMLELNPIVSCEGGGSFMPESERYHNATVFRRYREVVEDVGYESAKQVNEVRRLLQSLGTDAARRHLGDDVWVNHLLKRVADSGMDYVIVTDVRFQNERDMIASTSGGCLVRVDRDVSDTTYGSDHDSELMWRILRYDYLIDNSSDLRTLEMSVRIFAKDVLVVRPTIV